MYEFEKEALVKDFSDETKDFLLKIGFKSDDNIAELFKNFVEEKGYDLENIYVNNTIFHLDDKNKMTEKSNTISDYVKTTHYNYLDDLIKIEDDKKIIKVSKNNFFTKLKTLKDNRTNTYLSGACGS